MQDAPQSQAPPSQGKPGRPHPVVSTQYLDQADQADRPRHPAEPAELELDGLVREVLARNPTLQAAVEAWRAAAQRYPQVISLEDPMLGFMKGTREGWMIEASQKLPWPGKRQHLGNMAAAEAEIAQYDAEQTRLRLTEAARLAFFDYYQADRQLTVNRAAARAMQQFRQIAKTRYETGQASDQDILQAEVELAALEAGRAELLRERTIAAARINTLMHRAADSPLPPPAEVAVPEETPVPERLAEQAIQRRPELAAHEARICAEENALALACKDYYPDFQLAARYDAFMPDPMRTQVGLDLNVPLGRRRRHAAVQEAAARLRQRRAELEGRRDAVRFEVHAACQRLVERRQVAALYRDKILPAVQANLQSARAKYVAGQLDFLRLIEAQRQLQTQQERYYTAVADSGRAAAELERAVGGPAAEGATGK
ncbi:MAG: TolC family protein [Thermoguttaceae bacterium]